MMIIWDNGPYDVNEFDALGWVGKCWVDVENISSWWRYRIQDTLNDQKTITKREIIVYTLLKALYFDLKIIKICFFFF